MQFLRTTLLKAEIDQLRSHGSRTVARVEQALAEQSSSSLHELEGKDWLQHRWQKVIPQQERRTYAAVVNNDGEIVMHSDQSRRGKHLPRNWYDRVLFEVGDDVVETRSSVLAFGKETYDVRVPIEIDNREIGEYHAGFDVAWFENWTAERQAPFLRRRFILSVGVLLIVLLATTALYYIASHSITLHRAVDSASIERATEVGKLAAGLAHEIRNPLHAIQLNLHAFRRSHEQSATLSAEETTRMLEQSTREIDRIEQLMQQLIAFATPDEPQNEIIDLTSEIENVVEFIQLEMLDKNIQIHTQVPERPLMARMDQGRLRQIMLNLLQNAQQAMEEGGQITVRLVRRRGRAEITVADNGPGIPEDDRRRVFEPFFSTKEDGTGLGLALVKRFVDEVEGDIYCEPNSEGGITFRVVLQAASSRGPQRK